MALHRHGVKREVDGLLRTAIFFQGNERKGAVDGGWSADAKAV